MKIILNSQGEKIHPHLAKERLNIYGIIPNPYSFVVWDKILNQWVYIPTYLCEGEEQK